MGRRKCTQLGHDTGQRAAKCRLKRSKPESTSIYKDGSGGVIGEEPGELFASRLSGLGHPSHKQVAIAVKNGSKEDQSDSNHAFSHYVVHDARERNFVRRFPLLEQMCWRASREWLAGERAADGFDQTFGHLTIDGVFKSRAKERLRRHHNA